MSAVLSPQSIPAGDVNSRLAFQKTLQTVTNRIHATNNVDEIMLEVSSEICTLFYADRLTIYITGEDKASIISKVKTGLNSFRDLKLPLAEHSLAGYCGMSRKMMNLKDVYDDGELKSHNTNLRFLQEVDKRTGYRTKQMLVAPILDAPTGDLLGVVQLINNKAGISFGSLAEEGMVELCKTLAIALKQRSKLAVPKSKYDFLVADAMISAAELETAARSARKKALDIEAVLIEDFSVKPNAIGQALAKYFGVPYEPFKPDRIKSVDLLKNLKREYVAEHQWCPLEENPQGLLVMCLDPERVKASKVVNNIFPKARIKYCVTTLKEFKDTLDAYFGAAADLGDIGDLLEGLGTEDGDDGSTTDDALRGSDNELVKLVNKIIVDALPPGRLRHPHRALSGESARPRSASARTARSCTTSRCRRQLPQRTRRAPQDHVRPRHLRAPQAAGRQDQVQEVRPARYRAARGDHSGAGRRRGHRDAYPRRAASRSRSTSSASRRTISASARLRSRTRTACSSCCGPTGSGKTTTLHSVLGYLNTPDTKIWTAEDPVEITQKGLRQVQVNRRPVSISRSS